jgi:hypothetical protein
MWLRQCGIPHLRGVHERTGRYPFFTHPLLHPRQILTFRHRSTHDAADSTGALLNNPKLDARIALAIGAR